MNEDIDKADYRWIMELAEHKRDALPLLKIVSLSDSTIVSNRPRWETEEWDPPLHVDFTFDDANIDLSVRVRMTK